MQECNSPRNSWRKLIKTMGLGAEPEPASPRILRPNIGLIDLRMPKKLKPIQLSATSGGGSLEISRFFFLLSIVRRKRNDSVPVSTM